MAFLKPPAKRSRVYDTESSNSENDDEPEEENLCDDTVTTFYE